YHKFFLVCPSDLCLQTSRSLIITTTRRNVFYNKSCISGRCGEGISDIWNLFYCHIGSLPKPYFLISASPVLDYNAISNDKSDSHESSLQPVKKHQRPHHNHCNLNINLLILILLYAGAIKV